MQGLIEVWIAPRKVSHSWTYNYALTSGQTSRRLDQTHDPVQHLEKEVKFIKRQLLRSVVVVQPLQYQASNLDETMVALSPAPQNRIADA
eukprot:2415366-Amphidinium_carterae.1